MVSYYAYPGMKDTELPSEKKTLIGCRMRDKSPEVIIKKICEFYGQEEKKVLSVKRKREFVWCRHVFFYFCNIYTHMTKVQIGKFMGGRDHTTVIHGQQTVQDILDTDPAKVKELREIEYMILFVPTVGGKE